MKTKFPQRKNLEKIYDLFQSDRATWKDFFSCFQWVRFDPRLGEILIDFMLRHWRLLNPMEAHHALENTDWPQVFAVLGEHVKLRVIKEDRSAYGAWFDCATSTLQPAAFQLFYVGLFPFGGKRAHEEVERSLNLYRRWGFFSASMITNKMKAQRNTRTLMKRSLRLRMLKELMATKSPITVTDYIEYVDGAVSRRTAEMDLKSFCQKRGQTKGSSYVRSRRLKLRST